MISRLRALPAALVAGAALLAACGDPTRPKAQQSVFSVDSLSIYALNGSPRNAPTALFFYAGTPVRADAGFGFDVALDIDSAGRPVLHPVRVIASGLATAHRVGLQLVSGSYEQLTKAPAKGYRYDSTLVAPVGATVAVEITESSACAYSYYYNYSTEIYGKFQVIEVDRVNRRMRVRLTVDPNCGFLSLVPNAVPKD